jgi:hypothetical protein
LRPAVTRNHAIACALAAALVADANAQERLADTGLYRAGSMTEVRAENLPFSPQYPLWSDGAVKRRWLYIPPGKFIDATRPDAWEFPAGTKLWKEFSHGRRVETRLIERLEDGTWRFAAYVWTEGETQATLARAAGIPALAVAAAPGGRYSIPSEPDCRACHEGAAVPVLGASALQLSPVRDALAPHAEPRRAGEVDLRDLVARGLLRNLPREILESPPRIQATTSTERAALGYLHGNCGHCHNDNGSPPPVDLVLAQSATGGANVASSLLGARSRYRVAAAAALIAPGRPGASLLALRMRSRDPQIQMPPLGTQQPDHDALELIERWIRNQPQTSQEH